MDPVLVIVNDLMFRSQIAQAAAATGVPVVFAAAEAELVQQLAAGRWPRALVDLNLDGGGALACVRALRAHDAAMPIVGFCAHVERDLQELARQAGCSVVVARSAFIRRLAAWLTGSDAPGA